jgi:NAD(P)-dependent dehydrogenase (short-subunit alcohol dehydrogenase family)
MDLHGRHVVVTGAAGALGGAVVETLLAAGAACHLPVRSSGGGLGTAAGKNARIVEGVNLIDERSVASFYAGCPPLWASVHLVGGYAAGALLDTTLERFRAQLDVNLVSAFLCCREAVRSMRRASPAGGGRLVNVGSRTAIEPGGGAVAYSAAKGALTTLTRALAAELVDEGITVNAVLPSTIDTAANRAAMPNAAHDRWTPPAEIAAAIAWLVSPGAGATSGALVPVYGRG